MHRIAGRNQWGLTALLIATHAALSTGQVGPSPITRAWDRQLSSAAAYSLVEPHLSVDPRDRQRLFVAGMARVSPGNQNLGCVGFTSSDGGVSWQPSDALRRLTGKGCADPWTAILGDGTAILSYLEAQGAGIAVARSPDGGVSWEEQLARLPGPHDHPMMAVDSQTGVIYLVSALSIRSSNGATRSAVAVDVSKDAGRSFSALTRHVISNTSYEALTPILIGSGRLAIGLIDHHDSSDRPLDRRRASVIIVSLATGTASEPLLVTEQCSRSRFVSWPSLAVMESGGAARLLFTCEAPDSAGVLIARSDNDGETWTEPVRIDGGSTWTHTPALASASDGMLAATWLERRDATPPNCWHVVAARSSDRGVTFSRAEPLSTAPSCPSPSPATDGVLQRFPTGGEYYGLVPASGGEFIAVWPDARDGSFQLHAARFAISR